MRNEHSKWPNPCNSWNNNGGVNRIILKLGWNVRDGYSPRNIEKRKILNFSEKIFQRNIEVSEMYSGYQFNVSYPLPLNRFHVQTLSITFIHNRTLISTSMWQAIHTSFGAWANKACLCHINAFYMCRFTHLLPKKTKTRKVQHKVDLYKNMRRNSQFKRLEMMNRIICN